MNPFEEAEEDNYTSPTTEHPDHLNPFKDDMVEDSNKSNNSTNPFEESEELDDSNPFSDSYSSLERQKKTKSAPVPPRSKSQTLPEQKAGETPPPKPERKAERPQSENVEKPKSAEKVHRYVKSPKKKAPGPPRPMYEGTPPSSPKEERKSRSLTPPTVSKTEKPVTSTPNTV